MFMVINFNKSLFSIFLIKKVNYLSSRNVKYNINKYIILS